MSVPQPPSPVKGHCGTTDNQVLYVYDQDSFQSLPLKENATWSKESIGQSVASPACAKAVSGGDESTAALYVIGGDTDDGDYPGLQRYFFGNKTWETIYPLANVLQTRTNHSVAYLNDSQSILVYGGSPADAPSQLSSQTFLISTEPPYNIQSFISHAPPANNAILTPWNSSHAVMVGGQPTNTDVWLFGPEDGWQRLSTNLTEPPDTASRAVIVDGSDGSKVLQLYNFHLSPNTVQDIVLLEAGGTLAPTGVTVGTNSTATSSKRDLTLSDWPSYNSSNAPTATRADCSLSQGSDGLMIMAGGNDDDPIALFDQNENSWVDANKFFNSKQEQQPLQPSSTSTSNPTPTESTPSNTTSALPGLGGSAHDKTMRTLGITLGTLLGIAAVFIIVLLILRWRKLKAKKANGGGVEEKENGGQDARMSFQDRGASFMKEAGMSAGELSPPSARYGSNNNSHSSLAIIAGRIGNKRNTGTHQSTRGSFESTTHLFKDRNGNLVPGENHEMMDIGDKASVSRSSTLAVPGAALDKDTKAERKRSSGWSKYFATSAPGEGLSHIPSVYVKPNTLSVTSQYTSDDQTPSQTSRIPSSALVPPLDIDFNKTVDGQRLSHVAQGSPAIFDSKEEFVRRGGSLDVQDGQKGVIVDPSEARKSQANSVSSYGNRSTLSSTLTTDYYNEFGQTPWTPMSGNASFKEHMSDRPTSSVYTTSLYDGRERRPSRGKGAGFFPGAGTNYRPPKVKMSHAAGPSSDWAAPPVMPAAKAETNRDSAASNVTVFPSAKDFETPEKKDERSVPDENQATPGAPQRESNLNADMSWLNLELNKNQS